MARFKLIGGDLNGDGRTDLVWRDLDSGENYYFPMNGTAVQAGEGSIRTVADINWKLTASGDFDGDGKDDLLWRNSATGENYLYFMDGRSIKPSEGFIRTVADQNWQVAGVGDFDGDAKDDILWRNSATGQNYVYFMDGKSIKASEGFIRTVTDLNWQVAGVGDFDGDAKADILWRNSATGENYLYFMDGKSIKPSEGFIRTVTDPSWQVAGVGDFNGDARADIVWRNSATGENYVYLMNGKSIITEGYIRSVADQNWQVATVGDFDGDGKDDIFWRNDATGENYLYPMNGLAIQPNEGNVRSVGDGDGGAVVGTEGDDTLIGTTGDDTIDGLGGNDSISGVGGTDRLIGGTGNDTLDPGDVSSDDTLDGGLGDDTYVHAGFTTSESLVLDAGGTDTVIAKSGFHIELLDGLENLVLPSTFVRSPQAFDGVSVVGNAANNMIRIDSDSFFQITGGAGNDTLIGGPGTNFFRFGGGYGDDSIDGSAGFSDLITFDSGVGAVVDFRSGTASGGGTGTIRFSDVESAQGGSGGDRLVADDAGRSLLGNYGADTLIGGAGDDHLFAGWLNPAAFHDDFGTNQLYGGGGNDTLESGASGDTLSGGLGIDVLSGFLGDDVFLFDVAPGAANADFAGFGDGEDEIHLDARAMPALGRSGSFGAGDERFASGPGFTSGRDATDRIIYDTSTGNLYYDADGNGAGVSQLIVTLQGQPLHSSDIHVINGTESTPGMFIVGTAGNDSLKGGSGDDTLDGLGGVDTLDGGLGDDFYLVTQGDIIVTDPGGNDTVQSPVSWALGSTSGLENLFLSGTSAASAQGNNADNRIEGNSAANTLNGRAGNDTIMGNGGDDVIDMSAGGTSSYGNDVIDGGAGFDTLDFQGSLATSSLDIHLGAGIGTASSGGNFRIAGIERVYGGHYSDRLIGDAVANQLFGQLGNDTLIGSGGNDTLSGGENGDAFVFSNWGSANADRIIDFVSGTDELWFDSGTGFPTLGSPSEWAAGDPRFNSGPGFTSGRDSTDRLVYDTNTGNLYYDFDGNGSGAAQLVVTLQGIPSLSASDITVT